MYQQHGSLPVHSTAAQLYTKTCEMAMSNPKRHNAADSIFTVSSNVTTGSLCPSFVSPKNTGQRRHSLFPKLSVVGLIMSTLCNPVLGGVAVFAYLRARHAYKRGRHVRAVNYLNFSFVIGIIGISISIMAAVVLYIHFTDEDKVIVNNKFEKFDSSTKIPKYVGYLHGKNAIKKTREQQMKEEKNLYNTTSKEQVQVVDVVFGANDTFIKSPKPPKNAKMDIGRLLNSTMGKGKTKTIRTAGLNSETVRNKHDVLPGVRNVRDTKITRARGSSTIQRKQSLNPCQQLQLLLKGNAVKVRMKVKHPVLQWKPVVIEITDHTKCVVVE
ncbi:uncharacterized protein LOC132560330 [Ylistrum balloti]|uniref:uncharacterized protein LOC132560330 n=1 Tax=Ylistrum balloti TaxID=509963 RepID=UPI002905D04F|nr:uncharacterized protein LOC132560330 [Ylistrum balloti]